jgi:hypothetical protein
MNPGDPIRSLSDLREAAGRISADLVDLELDSSRKLLEASPLEGQSAARWSEASDQLKELWRRQGLLEDLLRRSEQKHAPPQTEELQELLDDMPAMLDDVTATVSEMVARWETLIPQLDAARKLYQETSVIAEELGQPDDYPELMAASDQLNSLSRSVTRDPLSVAADDVDNLLGSLRRTRAELEGSAALKRSFETRILEARERLDQLKTWTAKATAARETLLVKIATPSCPPAPEEHEELAAELSAVTELAGHGAWRDARRALEALLARTAALIEEARQTSEECRAPIEARNQFRALLDAYQVKAMRLGLLEEPDVASIFREAHTELYTAPTDLAKAARLVRSYQEALSKSSISQEVTP